MGRERMACMDHSNLPCLVLQNNSADATAGIVGDFIYFLLLWKKSFRSVFLEGKYFEIC